MYFDRKDIREMFQWCDSSAAALQASMSWQQTWEEDGKQKNWTTHIMKAASAGVYSKKKKKKFSKNRSAEICGENKKECCMRYSAFDANQQGQVINNQKPVRKQCVSNERRKYLKFIQDGEFQLLTTHQQYDVKLLMSWNITVIVCKLQLLASVVETLIPHTVHSKHELGTDISRQPSFTIMLLNTV